MALALLGFAFVGCASGPEFPEVSEFGAAPETTPASAPEPVSSPEPAPAHTEPTRAEGATAAIRGMLPPFLGGTSSGSEAKPVPEEPGGYSIVGVFYATNRERTGSLEPKRFYNETRGDLEYGRAYVTIPQSHQHGLLETRRFYELLTDEDPDDHITVAQLRPYGSEDIFLEGLRRGFRGKDPREVLLVVHGFNSSFEMSVRRTAQIACDTDFAGTPLVFSWASRGKRNLVPSTADAAEIESAQPHLTDLLLRLETEDRFQRVHIFAHSIGARLLSHSIRRAREQGFRKPIGNIVLASPDIRADAFEKELLPSLEPVTRRVSLYYNWRDVALAGSGMLRQRERLGSGFVPVSSVDNIDVSRVSVDFLGHADYTSSLPVIRDIGLLLNQGKPPPARGLKRAENGAWIFP